MQVAGMDIWKGKWVAVVLEQGRFDTAFFVERFDAATALLERAVAIGVDIPIGLPEPGQRRVADQMARTYVGPRWQSVFLTPSLDVLQAPSLAAANEQALRDGRERTSAQTFALRKAILEVQPMALADDRIHEVHPEASFVRANGGRHLGWSKTSWNGLNLRRLILERQGIVVPDDLHATGAVGIADVLDAAVVAWSAHRIARQEAEPFPPGGQRVGTIWG